MFTEVTAYVDKLIKEKKLPLLDVRVYKNHELLYSHCGTANGAHGKDDLLCMFSCSKVVTAVAAMRLIEEGKIALDDPVSKYIPGFDRAYTVSESGERISEVITVRHLFTMSSGLDYKLTVPNVFKIAKEKHDTATTTDVILALLENPLHFHPGKRFLYSLSHDALGALIEEISGMSLDAYMKKYIFHPLGMKNSTMNSEGYISAPPKNYVKTDDGFEVEKGNSYKHFHPTKKYSSGGAGLISTTEDYAIFADALASGGKGKDGYSLLKPETIEKMKELHFDAVDVDCQYTCVQGKDYGYGLGVRVRTKAHECGIPKGEFGWDGAAGSYTLVDTENGISVTMGMNILEWPNTFRGEHLEIVKRVYADLM